jgi:acetoin utilization deacetylase AcuC-like enzyme
VKSVLIVDLDVHQGNGTAHIFNQRPEVFTWSVHGERNYPLRKMSSDLDIGLADGMSDVDYLKIIKNTFPKLIQDIQPDIVLYLAGVDVLDSDKLGRLSLTREGCKKRDAYIMSECKKHKLPISISMGGGYSHKISDIIEAHANTFRCAQEIFF